MFGQNWLTVVARGWKRATSAMTGGGGGRGTTSRMFGSRRDVQRSNDAIAQTILFTYVELIV